MLCNILNEFIWIWIDVYEICAKAFGRELLCALQVFLCALVSWPALSCARAHTHCSQVLLGTLLNVISALMLFKEVWSNCLYAWLKCVVRLNQVCWNYCTLRCNDCSHWLWSYTDTIFCLVIKDIYLCIIVCQSVAYLQPLC